MEAKSIRVSKYKNMYLALMLSIFFIVYSYTFGVIVESQPWFKDFYWDAFISLPITQLGRHFIYVLIIGVGALYFQKRRNYGRFPTFLTMLLCAAMLGLGAWYLFDASLRVVANLPKLVEEGYEVDKNVLSLIYWSSLIESFFSICAITIGFRLFAQIYARRELKTENRNHAIIFYRSVRWICVSVNLFIAFAFTFAFVTFLHEGIASALVYPYQSIGPLANAGMAVGMIYFSWEFTSFFIKSHKVGYGNSKNYRWKIATLFICGLFNGWVFHDALVVANDNLFANGFHLSDNIFVSLSSHLIMIAGVISVVSVFAVILTILSPSILTKAKKKE